MNQISSTPRYVYPVLFCAAAAQIMLALTMYINGDVRFHYINIKCFAEQFWQGDFYPRWCFNGNAGLGTLPPLFYFPLGNFIASLFYPLTDLGLPLASLYYMMCLLARFLAGVACYLWLSDIVSPGRAVLASIIFLFLPYHMELLSFRTAYAEMWLVVWMPLIFKYARRIALGEGSRNVALLALFSGLALLSHALCSVIVLFFAGLYVLFMSGKQWYPKFGFGFGVGWGALLAIFYLAPSLYYQQFTGSGETVWANLIMHWGNLRHGQSWLVLARFIMTGWLAVMVFYVWMERHRIMNQTVRREASLWIAMAISALFLLSPLGALVYKMYLPIVKITLPWRMQLVVDLGFVYLVAVWMQWLFIPLHKHAWKLGYAVFLLSIIAVDTRIGDVKFNDDDFNAALDSSYAVRVSEYRPKWVEVSTFEFANTFALDKDKATAPKAIISTGKGTVTVTQWSWDGIEFATASMKPMTVQLRHNYFPIWRARIDNENELPIRPQEKTGYMLMDIPAGEHTVRLTYSIFNGNPYLVYSYLASLLALLGIIGAMYGLRSPKALGS